MYRPVNYFCALCIMTIVMLWSVGHAQEKVVDISGQIRLRGENSDKDFDDSTDNIDYTLLRTRLNFKFTPAEHVTAFAQLQDSRTFGEEGPDGTSTLASLRNVDLHQGYVHIDKLFVPWLGLKLGRMPFNYGAQRLLGVNEFSNIGRSFDGSLLMIKVKNVQFDLLQSILHESLSAPDTVTGDQTLAGFWMKWSCRPSSILNVYALFDRDLQVNAADQLTFDRRTIGSRFDGKLKSVNLEIEANLQTGTMDFTRDILALYVSGALAYPLPTRRPSQLSVGVDYLSGDKSDTEQYECFNTLYPAKHRHFGYMDYFTDIPRHTQNLGLTDYMVKAKFSPVEKLGLEGDMHFFRLSQDAALENNIKARDLGSELDLAVIFEYAKSVNFTFGGSMFVPGEVFKEWKGQDPSFWFFAHTVVNF